MRTRYERFVKRPLDCFFAILLTVLASPILLVLAILVRVKLGSPVLFSQERPGLNGKIFRLHKFRSMTDARDENGKLLPDEVRLTSFGKKLRASSLDELPELFNIIKGDMSFIGPRPLLVSYLDRYTPEQARRHEVLPGMTGLAQVNGRNSLRWEEKFALDVQYVDNISFRLDWKIFWQTIGVVLGRKDISSDTSATMEEFYGTNEKDK